MKKKRAMITYKGFWGRLFCNHDTIRLEDVKAYSSVETFEADLPSEVYTSFQCKKCGKNFRYKQ